MTQPVNKTGSSITERRLRQGRGQGEGRNYTPWIKTHEVPSLGLSHRYHSDTTERIVHLLSNLEYAYALKMEWAPTVVDFREQYPLPSAATSAIAADCGIRYPGPKDGSYVMTTDFLVTVEHHFGRVRHARTTKYACDLTNPRTQELLTIERLYWEQERVHWAVVTEHGIPWILVANVELIRQHRNLDQHPHSRELRNK